MQSGIVYSNKWSDKAILTYSFILAVLYWNGISGAATSPRWAFLAVVTPLFLFFYKESFRFTLLHLIGLFFIVWCFVSLSWSFNKYDTIGALIKLLILAQVFILGSKLETLKYVFIGLAFGLFVSNFVSFEAGLFVNRDVLSETALFILIGLLTYKLWWYSLLTLPSFIADYGHINRGIFLAGIVLFGIWIWNKSRLASLSVLFLLFVGCFLVYYFDYRLVSITERLEIWNNAFKGFSLLGHGYGTFQSAYPLYSDGNLIRPRFAHNEFVGMLFETGIIGLSLAVWFCINAFSGKEKYITLAFVLLASIYYSFNVPVSAFIFCITAGYISRSWDCIFSKDARSRKMVC